MEVTMLLPKHVHASWQDFLSQDRIEQIKTIESQLVGEYNPIDKALTLRFFELDLNDIKVVWLGQDVYPAKGVATGRSFEAGNISSWCQPFKQVSLKNILRLIHRSYNSLDHYEDILSYASIKKEISENRFKILPFKSWFDDLESQGVLFLNTSFTCAVGVSNSHKKYWQVFSEDLLKYISLQNPNIHWFLWGKEAISKQHFLSKGHFHTSRHPMMCSIKYEDDFLKSDCFLATKSTINWLGHSAE